jgi:hypothetical protein
MGKCFPYLDLSTGCQDGWCPKCIVGRHNQWRPILSSCKGVTPCRTQRAPPSLAPLGHGTTPTRLAPCCLILVWLSLSSSSLTLSILLMSLSDMKLATHGIQDVSMLFSLADKCVKATEGRAWYSPVAQVAKGESKPNVGTQTQGGSNGNNNNKNKKKASGNRLLAGAPTTAATAAGGGRGGPRGNKRPRQLSNSDDNNTKCPVHNSTHHTTSECREIKKLVEQFCDKM